jgi:enamine deaminase RidA (YjgF/YER057c/UK114 family)
MPLTSPAANPVIRPLTDAEREEMQAIGFLGDDGAARPHTEPQGVDTSRCPIERKAITAASVLNEAYAYPRPSSFARGIRFDLGDKTMLMISGTASIDDAGETRHTGDFRAQLWRTYRNITGLLAAEGAGWHDIVRTTCYLRDIERDYKDFNEVRTAFFSWLALDPLPASTAIQARLCREDLLVEIEAIAVFARDSQSEAR